MSYQTDMAAGFADAAAVLGGVTATVGATTFTIIPGDLGLMLALLPDGGGFLEQVTHGFTCKQADTPELKAGMTLTIGARSFRIAHVHPGLGNPLLNVFCTQLTV